MMNFYMQKKITNKWNCGHQLYRFLRFLETGNR